MILMLDKQYKNNEITFTKEEFDKLTNQIYNEGYSKAQREYINKILSPNNYYRIHKTNRKHYIISIVWKKEEGIPHYFTLDKLDSSQLDSLTYLLDNVGFVYSPIIDRSKK